MKSAGECGDAEARRRPYVDLCTARAVGNARGALQLAVTVELLVFPPARAEPESQPRAAERIPRRRDGRDLIEEQEQWGMPQSRVQ
jgi:hypothetical protein